ncbi:hypothetical protein Cpap_1470 [Ruminiclostridium papyrosolvens DSM 2782]|uniref:Replication terminator protein n=1 Tax=Ruminiclostridium papyrosolvens DSM 2782 TaxID=588581 RepID=F1TEB2_9FIRM|nr:hypothetical protein [Ruminiclostridium papyrosolvens]EGD47078.1 hypothetical protein Cpap_1470 [Ruminiclostridium papyrosolvens DSM 2782]WES36020.1 hypothetical protein P0092_08680 [Ruminiclostridium papyrosolvens DSM 2782]WES36118.1 hypothetical protein P0092_09180 [Ruminiclostridium papyrosolvens DSM 2782]
MDGLNILNLAKGALVEQADIEIQKVLENIADPNTDDKKARKLTITMTFKPLDRESAAIEVVTKSTVAPYKPVTTQVFIGRDDDSGVVTAKEYIKGQVKGQMRVVDEDTGEILEDNAEKQSSGKKILNINR